MSSFADNLGLQAETLSDLQPGLDLGVQLLEALDLHVAPASCVAWAVGKRNRAQLDCFAFRLGAPARANDIRELGAHFSMTLQSRSRTVQK